MRNLAGLWIEGRSVPKNNFAVSVGVVRLQSIVIDYVQLGPVLFQLAVKAFAESCGKGVGFPKPPNPVVWSTKAVGVVFWKNVRYSVAGGNAAPRVILNILPELL